MSLSDKIEETDAYVDMIRARHVKQLIRELKEKLKSFEQLMKKQEVFPTCFDWTIFDWIDEKVGEALI